MTLHFSDSCSLHATQNNLQMDTVKHLSLTYLFKCCYGMTDFGSLLFEPLQHFFPFSRIQSITHFLDNFNDFTLCKQHKVGRVTTYCHCRRDRTTQITWIKARVSAILLHMNDMSQQLMCTMAWGGLKFTCTVTIPIPFHNHYIFIQIFTIFTFTLHYYITDWIFRHCWRSAMIITGCHRWYLIILDLVFVYKLPIVLELFFKITLPKWFQHNRRKPKHN